jgi:uncharacterized protein YgbK (DUF1537 family)
MGVLIGVVADDFTGASDIANTFARSVSRRFSFSACRHRQQRWSATQRVTEAAEVGR